MKWTEAYDFLENMVGISKEALDLAFAVGGCNIGTAKFILCYYTGYWDFKQWMEDMQGA